MDRYFQIEPQWQVVICKQCKRAIWPEEVNRHLQSAAHRVPITHRNTIQQEICRRSDVIQTPKDWKIVHHVSEPIDGLTQYPTAMRCTASTECIYIATRMDSMRQHWSRNHPGLRGRKGRKGRKVENTYQRERTWYEPIIAQRFFTHGTGSNFFRVGDIEPADPIPIDAIAATKQQVRRAQQEMREETARIIQDRQEGTEFIPWLETIGWPKYLEGFDRQALMRLVEEPKEEEEPLACIVWQAMDRMLYHSQRTVKDHAGYFMRMEVVRTESKQTKYRPLQPYMDSNAATDYARPWKQIVVLFVRSHRQEEEGPRYRFNGLERVQFRKMIQIARRIHRRRVQRYGRDRPGSSGSDISRNSGSGGNSDHSSNNSNHYSNRGNSDGNSNDDPIPIRLSGLALHCLRFCMALLGRRTRGREYELPMIGAMAVLGIKPGGWRGPSEYPPIMSKVIKMSRFMVIQQAYQQVDEDHEDREYNEDDEPDLLRYITRMTDAFMIRGSQCSMQWILDRRAYGMKIHYTSTAEGHVDWVGDQIRYKGIEFSMDQLRSMVDGLVGRTYQALEEVLMVPDPDTPPIPWSRLRDDPTREGIGHNFVQDERNPWPVDGSTWLVDRLIERGTFRQRGDSMSKRKIEQWLEWVDRLRALILICAHITGGQPARGPEVLSIRHSSSGEGEGRNVFIEDSTVVMVTRYHKGYNISGDIKVIHRYLPRRVGALMVWYIWLVLPAVEALERIRSEGAYRQQWQVWAKDVQGRPWTPARMSREMTAATELGMGVGVSIQPWREMSIAISRKYMRKGEGRFRMDEEDWEEEGGEDEVEDMQAGHGTHVAGIVYARGIREQDGAVESIRQKYRQARENWHRFLGFHDPVDRRSHKRKRAGWEDEAEEGRRERVKRLRQVDIGVELKRMMKPEAEFRGNQRAIIEAIVRGEERVLAIMPTGSGKSLLFMLPAFCGVGGVTIVVVPLIALKQDLRRRCQEAGIDCQEWSHGRPPDSARIVLVTPESAIGDDFTRFVNRLKGQQRLDRIVIDECHIVLNEQRDFRPRMQELGELNKARVPIVMLTATLPVEDEGRFMKRMWVTQDEVSVFRESTTRKNVRYCIYPIQARTSKKQEEELGRMIEQKKGRLREGEKMVVYSNRVEDCRSLAESLGCEAYFHDQDDKTGIFERFRRADGDPMIVATSAFGMGIDVPHIRYVIHVSEPRTLFDYSQESGRAGRDGLRSEGVIVCGRMKGQSHEESGPTDVQQRLVKEYLQAPCKRVVLDRYLDGRQDREGCEEGEERCKGCGIDKGEEDIEREEDVEREEDIEREEEGAALNIGATLNEGGYATGRDVRHIVSEVIATPISGNIIERHRQQVHSEQDNIKLLRLVLSKMKGQCVYCYIVRAQAHESSHYMFRCPEAECQPIQETCQRWKKRMRDRRELANYAGCCWCYIPQAWCNRWREEGGAGKAGMYKQVGGKIQCEHQDVVVEVLSVLIHLEPGFREQMEGRMPKGMEREDVTQWWGRRVQWGGVTMYGMMMEVWEGLIMGK